MVAQKTSKLRYSDWLLRNFNQSESGYLSYHGEQNGGHHVKDHWKLSLKLVSKNSLHFVGSHHSEKQTVTMLGAAVPRHCQEQLTQTLIVCLLNKNTCFQWTKICKIIFFWFKRPAAVHFLLPPVWVKLDSCPQVAGIIWTDTNTACTLPLGLQKNKDTV